MPELQDKIALVTGSTKGIGRGIASGLAAQGARVTLHGRSESSLAEAAGELDAHAGVTGDLATSEGTRSVLHQLEPLARVDILVNNAGIFSVQDFFEIDDAEFPRYHETNVLSSVRMCRALMCGMLERGWGQIVNVASETGIKPLPQMRPATRSASTVKVRVHNHCCVPGADMKAE